MYAQFKGSGKEARAYIAKSYRLKKGDKTSTVIVESLGTLSDISAQHPGVDPREWVRERAKELTRRDREGSNVVSVELNPALSIKKGHQYKVAGGMLPLMPIFHSWMGLGAICEEITRRHSFEYDLSAILSALAYGRVLAPGSKLSTLNKSGSFIERRNFSLDDVYNSLSVLSSECDFIQKRIYENTMASQPRDTGVIYYDCTNYYFEIERSDIDMSLADGGTDPGLRKYGHSKEHRPNPIVQLGMFMDSDCMPLAFCVNPGNTAETQTIIPLEEKLADDFGLSKFVCCTDAGLGSSGVRLYNTTEEREYITVQSLKDKKIDPVVQKWAIADEGWHISGHEDEYTIAEAKELLGDGMYEAVLYKDRWYKVGKDLREEHFIVTYSEKYAQYQRATRAEQVARALKKIERGETSKPKSPNDCSRFIRTDHATDTGEVAEHASSSLDTDKIADEARFDGLYALATSLDDTPQAIMKANHMRYAIESLFRVTKTDLELRPVFLQRKDRIIGHFIVCFIALLLVTRLQKQLGGRYSIEKIIECLRGWDYTLLDAHGYIPAFDRTDLTDDIKALVGQKLDAQIITKPTMRAIVRELSKR